MSTEKLQKLRAQAGLGSRRACEQTIRQGRVSVNGRIARLGERADLQTDEVRVDGVPLRSREPLTYIALHKPPGGLSSSQSPGGDPKGSALAWPCRVDLEPRKGEQVGIQVILTQGRKRQIRETAEALGLRVQRLIRTRLAGLP